MIKRAHVYIYGDVIGVGFRAWTVSNARQLGLMGWVRNDFGGDYPTKLRMVEAVFEGPADKIEEMIKRCHEGPSVARVEKVEVEWQEAKTEFASFEVKY